MKDTCTSINALAQMTGSNPRTIKKHLEIAEIDDIGLFVDSAKTIFCIKRLGNLFDDDARLAEVQKRWNEAFKDKTVMEILHRKREN